MREDSIDQHLKLHFIVDILQNFNFTFSFLKVNLTKYEGEPILRIALGQVFNPSCIQELSMQLKKKYKCPGHTPDV